MEVGRTAFTGVLSPDLSKSTAAASRKELLVELVKIDIEYRWRTAHMNTGRKLHSGTVPVDSPGSMPDRPFVEHYVEQFPELGPLSDLPDALITLEYQVRHLWGDSPGSTEYVRRFGIDRKALLDGLRQVDRELLEKQDPKVADSKTRTGSGGPRQWSSSALPPLSEPHRDRRRHASCRD